MAIIHIVPSGRFLMVLYVLLPLSSYPYYILHVWLSFWFVANIKFTPNSNLIFKVFWIGVGKRLSILMIGKLIFFHLIFSNKLFYWLKLDRFAVDKNNLLRCWDNFFLLNQTGVFMLSPWLEVPLKRKFEPWFVEWSFSLLQLCHIPLHTIFHSSALSIKKCLSKMLPRYNA